MRGGPELSSPFAGARWAALLLAMLLCACSSTVLLDLDDAADRERIEQASQALPVEVISPDIESHSIKNVMFVSDLLNAVEVSSDEPIVLSTRNILELRFTEKSRATGWAKGLIFGTLAGAATGGLIALTTKKDEKVTRKPDLNFSEFSIALGTTLFGFSGSMFGFGKRDAVTYQYVNSRATTKNASVSSTGFTFITDSLSGKMKVRDISDCNPIVSSQTTTTLQCGKRYFAVPTSALHFRDAGGRDGIFIESAVFDIYFQKKEAR